MSVIFLAGVHGVGKGYLGSPVAKLLGLEHFTASQLIREEKGKATWGANKIVTEVDDNQLALVRAVKRKRDSEESILLDGHFVLRNTSGKFVRLNEDVFAGLELTGVILLTEKTEVIFDRLLNRDAITTSLAAISELAKCEYDHAHEICSNLKIPLCVLSSATIETLTEAVIKLQTKPVLREVQNELRGCGSNIPEEPDRTFL
jgi:adenylate kinase